MSVDDLTHKELRRFAGLHAKLHSVIEAERDKARRALDKWLKDRGLTPNDIPAIFVRVHQLDAASSTSPDPRDVNPSNPFADASVTPADVVCELIRRYVSLAEHQLVAATLWAMHTHVFDRFRITPRCHMRSPVSNCGKTTLLDIFALLVPRPDKCENISAAALYESLDVRPKRTLLLDEGENLGAETNNVSAFCSQWRLSRWRKAQAQGRGAPQRVRHFWTSSVGRRKVRNVRAVLVPIDHNRYAAGQC
jgi:hypothetical protein